MPDGAWGDGAAILDFDVSAVDLALAPASPVPSATGSATLTGEFSIVAPTVGTNCSY